MIRGYRPTTDYPLLIYGGDYSNTVTAGHFLLLSKFYFNFSFHLLWDIILLIFLNGN